MIPALLLGVGGHGRGEDRPNRIDSGTVTGPATRGDKTYGAETRVKVQFDRHKASNRQCDAHTSQIEIFVVCFNTLAATKCNVNVISPQMKNSYAFDAPEGVASPLTAKASLAL